MSKAFKQIKEELNKARKSAKKTFADQFKDLFEKYPKLESIGWTQYTPYFNDGEACTFSSNHEYNQYYNGKSSDSYYDNNEDGSNIIFSNKELEDLGNLVSKLVGQFDDDDLEYMFGEGTVTVYKNGLVKTEDCEHD